MLNKKRKKLREALPIEDAVEIIDTHINVDLVITKRRPSLIELPPIELKDAPKSKSRDLKDNVIDISKEELVISTTLRSNLPKSSRTRRKLVSLREEEILSRMKLKRQRSMIKLPQLRLQLRPQRALLRLKQLR
jgi:hypothetical protein